MTLSEYLKFLHLNIWSPDRAELISSAPAELGTMLAELTDSELARQYSAVFDYNDADVMIPLWESYYAEGRHLLLDGTTLEVTREYYSRGLKPANIHQPADFVGYETEFVLYLLELDADSAYRFYKRHLRPLLQGIAETVLNSGAGDYYKALSRFVLDSRPEYVPGIGFDPAHFEPITPEEAEKSLTLRAVNTAGRGNCGSKCAITAYTAAGCLTRLDTDISEGEGFTVKACARGRGYRRTFLGGDRLRCPMVRTGQRGEGKFRRVSWDEAIDLMVEKLTELTAKYGPGCRFIQYGSGVSTTVRGDTVMKRLLSRTGGYLDKYNDYSAACANTAVPYTYGTVFTSSSLETYKKTNFLILWGGNPAVTLYNYRTFDYLTALRNRGVPIVVIDPQFSDTAAVFSTQWIPIRPGTDSALASAMAYVILDRGLQDQSFMDKFCLGFDSGHMPEGCEQEESYTDYIFGLRDGVPKSPEWAAEITGIPAETITDLAVRYASAKPAAIIPGLGLQRHSNGEQSVRSISVLQPLTGNVGIEGGGTGARGHIIQHHEPKAERWPNPYGGSIPVFLWTDALFRAKEMTPEGDHIRGRDRLDSNIKLMFSMAGNTLVNQHSDINRTIKLLKDTDLCEFIVLSDIYMTPSARYADLLLPGTSLFENDAMTPPWEEGDYLLYSNQVIPPLFESRYEFDWVTELARRMGAGNISDGCEDLRQWLNLLYDRLREQETELPEFEEFAKNGGYKYRNNRQYIPFKEQISDFEHNPFPTPSGKIEVFSRRLQDMGDPVNIPAIPKYVPGFEGVSDPKRAEYPLQLIGWHTKRRTHSIGDNSDWMEDIEPHRLWINPKDAAERGIKEGMKAIVYNDRGRVEITAHLSDRIMEGVVCIPQGAWYTPDKDGTDLRGSTNTLTTSRPTPLAKANPQHSNLVEVKAAEGREGK